MQLNQRSHSKKLKWVLQYLFNRSPRAVGSASSAAMPAQSNSATVGSASIAEEVPPAAQPCSAAAARASSAATSTQSHSAAGSASSATVVPPAAAAAPSSAAASIQSQSAVRSASTITLCGRISLQCRGSSINSSTWRCSSSCLQCHSM